MSEDAATAFAHPLERAIATAPQDPHDRISLRDFHVDIEIGAFEVERDVAQRVCFNVVVEVRAPSDLLNDNVDAILSYDKIRNAIEYEIAAERVNLLETLAERIATRILQEPQALRVFVRAEKLDRGPGALGVEIVRSGAQDAARAPVAQPPLDPIALVYCDDQHVDPDAPRARQIFVPILDDTDVGTATKSELRIWLLSLDQMAWRIAALRPEAMVCSTRTEFEWAMSEGAEMIWAPSKMILDQVEIDGLARRGSAAMAQWFARQWPVASVRNLTNVPIADMRNVTHLGEKSPKT